MRQREIQEEALLLGKLCRLCDDEVLVSNLEERVATLEIKLNNTSGDKLYRIIIHADEMIVAQDIHHAKRKLSFLLEELAENNGNLGGEVGVNTKITRVTQENDLSVGWNINCIPYGGDGMKSVKGYMKKGKVNEKD